MIPRAARAAHHETVPASASTVPRGHTGWAAPDLHLQALREAQLRLGSHQAQGLGHAAIFLPAVNSTNDVARTAARADATHGLLVVADQQCAGRGTHGRPWLSPAGTDLYLSLLLDPARYAASLPQLTLAAGLALSRTCGPLVDTQANLQLKWPNDLYLAGRKCAGVLIEARQEAEGLQPLVLGIGLNVNRQHFPAPLADSATSLRKHLRQPAPPWYCRHSEHGWQLKRATVLAQLLRQLEIALHCLTTPTGSAQVVQAVQQRLRWRGERVRCGGAEGRLVGLAPDGALMLDSGAGGLLTCYSGHVTLCGDSEENGS